MARIAVVLPAPLGPRKPATSPAGTSKDRSSRAMMLPKLLRSPSSSSRSPTSAGYLPTGIPMPAAATGDLEGLLTWSSDPHPEPRLRPSPEPLASTVPSPFASVLRASAAC